jgi:hypothetical protein
MIVRDAQAMFVHVTELQELCRVLLCYQSWIGSLAFHFVTACLVRQSVLMTGAA